MGANLLLSPSNEVWGKVIFLHLSVILFTGGVPGQVHPGISACWEIRATSGRYASYWNAFLFGIFFAENCMKKWTGALPLDPQLLLQVTVSK